MSQVDSNLYDIFQNSVIGALACHSFTLGYYKRMKAVKAESVYPELELLFYVIPIVFHKSTLQTFNSSNELYTAILNNKSISLGLQERANKMSQQTFDALNIAFSKKILSFHAPEQTIILCHGFKSEKIKVSKNLEINLIQNAAFKLGSIFAKNSKKNIQIDLNIRF